MNATQLLYILKARWLTALITILLAASITVGISLALPKTYTATTSILLDPRATDPVGSSVAMAMASPSYMATQVDIIMSDKVAQRVVQKLKLTDNPEMRNRWLAETQGKGNYEQWAANLFKKRLTAKPAKESSIINVSYAHNDPRFAAALANTFSQAYIDVSVGLRTSPAKQSAEFLEARSKELRESLEQAQEKLSSFHKQNGLINADERYDAETQRLTELTSQLVAIQAMAAESNSRTAQSKTSADQIQDVMNNGLVTGLRADINRLEARLVEMNSRLGEEHPQVKELKANIAEMRHRIEIETRRVTGSVGVTNTIYKQRESEIKIALENQRTKLLRLKGLRDEAIVLQQEVVGAQRNYDQVAQRMNQTNLESQITQSNISILSPAAEPADPSSPRVFLNALIAVFLGTILGVGLAVIREFTDRRVRTLEDLSNHLDILVLGSLPKPNRGSLMQRNSPLVMPKHIFKKLPIQVSNR